MNITHEMRAEGSEQQKGLIDLCNFIASIIPEKSTIIEIGSYCGGSTSIIAKIFKHSKIFSVDPWEMYIEDCSVYDINKQKIELEQAEKIFDGVIKNYTNIVKNKTSSSEFVKNIEDNTIDFIYIDGNHQYSSVKEDLENWYPKIKLGGIIAGHDYGWPTVRRAIDEIFNNTPPNNIFIDGSWCFIKK